MDLENFRPGRNPEDVPYLEPPPGAGIEVLCFPNEPGSCKAPNKEVAPEERGRPRDAPTPSGEPDNAINPPYEPRQGEGIDPLDWKKGIDLLFWHCARRGGTNPLAFVPPGTSVPMPDFSQSSGGRQETAKCPLPGDEEKAHKVNACVPVPDLRENGISSRISKPLGESGGKKTEQDSTAASVKGQECEIIRAEDSSATNFTVQPICKYVFFNRKGQKEYDKGYIECVVHIAQREPERIEIKSNEVGSIAKIITRRFPEAILDFEEKKAEKAIEVKFRNAMRSCPVKAVYTEAGWQRIANRQVYLRDGLDFGSGIRIQTGMTLPAVPCGVNALRDIFQKTLSMYRDFAAMSVMFVFSLMGVLFRPFKEAGFQPHFTLFLNGKTGSMKTTIAKILFTQLCEDRYRDNPRRIDADTAASLERAVVLTGYDTVTLIDDFSPAKTKAKRQDMEDKLEMLIRMVGDGSSRSRSNTRLEDRRGEGVQGMVALTGELMGRGLSSNLRCLYCRMERDEMNEKAVSWFQENSGAYTTLIAVFADFVSGNYGSVTELIRKRFNSERKALDGMLKEKRLIDSAVTLRIAADIFSMFLAKCCQMPDKEAEDVTERMKTGILECAKISEDLSKEESSGITFVQAIAELMRVGQVMLNTDKVKMAEASEYDGFEDDGFLYFNPEIIHKKVVSFLQRTNRYFPYEPKEVYAMLADDGIIKTASNGAGKRTYCVRIPIGSGRKHNFLKIRKTIFESICEGNYDYEKGEKQ